MKNVCGPYIYTEGLDSSVFCRNSEDRERSDEHVSDGQGEKRDAWADLFDPVGVKIGERLSGRSGLREPGSRSPLVEVNFAWDSHDLPVRASRDHVLPAQATNSSTIRPRPNLNLVALCCSIYGQNHGRFTWG